MLHFAEMEIYFLEGCVGHFLEKEYEILVNNRTFRAFLGVFLKTGFC